jgi:hypothetical protein
MHAPPALDLKYMLLLIVACYLTLHPFEGINGSGIIGWKGEEIVGEVKSYSERHASIHEGKGWMGKNREGTV